MKTIAARPDEYMSQIEGNAKADRVARLRHTATENRPPGFVEQMSYGMLTYGGTTQPLCVRLSLRCHSGSNPLLSIRAQMNFVALYQMGIYADLDLLHWVNIEYAARVKTKLDMGKSCIRLKKPQDIPLERIGELMKKMNPQQRIS